MTVIAQPSRHPREDLLLEHAAGHEHPAAGLLVAVHAALCESCRSAAKDLETIGALVFAREDQMPVSASLRERTLAAVRSPRGDRESSTATEPPQSRTRLDDLVQFVLRLRHEPQAGRWHWRAPGVREVRLPIAWNGIPVTVTRLRRGLRIPQHTHSGRELTLVLAGCLADATAEYVAGDVADYDSEHSHRQVVGSDEDCLCLVVRESRLVPQTPFGRVLAWITGV